MADIMTTVNAILANTNEKTMEEKNTFNAPTLGLGFHQFNGTESVEEVLNRIGGNFEVESQPMLRVPSDIMDAIKRGEAVTIDPRYLINSHKANVRKDNDMTIGVVGKDYGLVQNTVVGEMLDLMCNATVSKTPLEIVSGGRVHENDIYIQCRIPFTARISGDDSETVFYAMVRNSHDGTCGVQCRVSTVRIVCQNTFNQNISSKNGVTFKHSKNVGSRVDFTNPDNVKVVQKVLYDMNKFSADYIERMNSFALAKVTDDDINEFIAKLFVSDAKMREEARKHGYNYDLTEVSTRTKNVIESFRNTLESGAGQNTNRGTKLWLFNGVTNYFSNVANYGNKAKDSALTLAEKRFDSLSEGSANRKANEALALLA